MRVAVFWLLLVAVLALGLPGAGVQAQTAPDQTTATVDPAGIDYAAWEAEATRAESLIDSGRASTAFLQNLRASLVSWRARFLAAQDTNSSRIEAIQAQLDALGPAPAEGEAEADAIAERRAELNEQLVVAELPRLSAAEAFSRAEGLIRELDTILAQRQARRLLELDPTPLNPVNWGITLSSLGDLFGAQGTEFAETLMETDVRAQARARLGGVLMLAALGIFLIVRARSWAKSYSERFHLNRDRPGRVSLSYLLSLGQLVLPMAGVIALLLAVERTGLVGVGATALITAAFGALLSAFVGIWLAGRLVPQVPDPHAVMPVPDHLRARARRGIVLIGTFMGLSGFAETLAIFDYIAPGARGVLVLPVYLGLSYGFWIVAKVIQGTREALPEDEPLGFVLRATVLLARGLVVIAFVGPVLAAIGYLNAAEALMIPTALSLTLLGIVLSLQVVIRDLYAVIYRSTEEAATEALAPVVVNFLLAFAVSPLLALAWGVRYERLTDFYTRFLGGFSVAGVQITPAAILAVLIVFVIGYMATRVVQNMLKSTVLPRTRLDTGARNAIISGVGYVGIALASVVAITAGGIDLTALGFVVGALSVGIGFGLQNVVSNFVSGIILLIERPISEGDWIEVNGNMGIVKDISVRSTRIETFDRTDVIVPNADFISGTVTNWTRGNDIGRAVITVGVAYGTDTRKVAAILHEIARAHPMVARFPEPGVDFLGFGADSLDFRIRAILRDVNQLLTVKTEINHQIAERFTKDGIEIPFAQRDIWLRNPESLQAAAGPVPAQPPASDTPPKETPT